MGHIIRRSRMAQLMRKESRGHSRIVQRGPSNNARVSVVHKTHDSITSISTIKCKHITSIMQSGMWEGNRCFILGGGPSLANLNFQDIAGELTIGINKSFTKFNTTINYSMDQRFYDYLVRYDKKEGKDAFLYEKWKAYEGIKVFLEGTSKFRFESDVYVIGRLSQRVISLNLTKGIYPGNNSGFGAIMLAAALGADPIYLLGYDMKVSGEQTHWHDGYPNQTAKLLSDKLKKYANLISEFAPSYEAAGFDIINLTPGSALTCFKTSTLSEVLRKEPANPIGPIAVVNKEEKREEKKEKSERSSMPVIISFYTKDTGYEEEANRLINSLKRLQLDYEVVPINNTGNWQKNVKYKPTLIKNMLKKHAPRPVLYVDCDAIFLSPPVLFDKFEHDFALYKTHWADFGRPDKADEVLGGTIYAANNKRVFNVLDRWISECNKQPIAIWDQKILQDIVKDDFYKLPPEYCTIFDAMKKVENPVIKHFQASRRLKGSVRRGARPRSVRRASRAV